MRKLILIAALFIPLAAQTQPTRDANPREDQNTQGANSRVHNETSSDREEGRGARGAIR